MKVLMIFSLLCFYGPLAAQKIFTEAELVAVVKRFHPVGKQALLDVRIAEANLRASRAPFDPVATFNSGRKDFDGIRYYDQQWTELKIPTWYGVDIHAGTESIKGSRINPEETKGSINYLGASVPLMQGLVIDKRRAAVRQAQVMKESSELSRQAAVNDLMAEALLAYWDWWEQHHVLEVIQASVNNARVRLGMVKRAHALGDRPAIDTLEAATQVQFFEQQKTEAYMLLQKSRLELSNFLWTEKDFAYQLPEDAQPEKRQPATTLLLDSLLADARTQPILLQYRYKLKSLGIDKRLKFQSLLPEVTAKYNSISRDLSKTFNGALFDNNYRFGLAVSVPLRLSEGRGAYRAATLKMEQTRLEQVAKEVATENKVKQYFIEWQQTSTQFNQQQQLVANYRALERGENLRFDNGESSLFLVNAREAKTLEGQRKEVEIAAKIEKAAVRLRWASGRLIYQ